MSAQRLLLLTAVLGLGACASKKPAVDDGISTSPIISPEGVYAQSKPRGLSAKEAASDKNVIGCVKVEYLVRPDGSATDVRILESVPAGYFDARVLIAMENMRFAPRDGISLSERTFSFAPRQEKEVLASAAKLCEHNEAAPLPPPPEGGLTGKDEPLPYVGAPQPAEQKKNWKLEKSDKPRRPTGRH